MTVNTWYFWAITIVLLDSFQIYINNSFILNWSCTNDDTTVIARLPFCHCEADETSRSNPVEGHRIATHLSGASKDIMEELKMTGKTVLGFMGLTT